MRYPRHFDFDPLRKLSDLLCFKSMFPGETTAMSGTFRYLSDCLISSSGHSNDTAMFLAVESGFRRK